MRKIELLRSRTNTDVETEAINIPFLCIRRYIFKAD